MALKPVSQSGRQQAGDAGADQSQTLDLMGTNAGKTTVSRVVLTGTFADTPDDPVVDMEDYDTLVVTVDYSKSAGTALSVRARYGASDATAELLTDEDREDNSAAAKTTHEIIRHEWTVTGVTTLVVKRFARYVKLQVRSEGTPDANDKLALSCVGHRRER